MLANGMVTGLDLKDRGLEDVVIPDMSKFTELRSLDVSLNGEFWNTANKDGWKNQGKKGIKGPLPSLASCFHLSEVLFEGNPGLQKKWFTLGDA